MIHDEHDGTKMSGKQLVNEKHPEELRCESSLAIG